MNEWWSHKEQWRGQKQHTPVPPCAFYTDIGGSLTTHHSNSAAIEINPHPIFVPLMQNGEAERKRSLLEQAA